MFSDIYTYVINTFLPEDNYYKNSIYYNFCGFETAVT